MRSIMTTIPDGRSRFDAVPKEQPPRKLSGKRTSGNLQDSGEKSFITKGSPKG
jgi:hypothetical protein